MAAGRRLIRLDKELEGRRGRKGRSGAVLVHERTRAGMPTCMFCSTSGHGNSVLIISVFLLENTHRVDQVDESCGSVVACN